MRERREVSQGETSESWWIETRPTRYGWQGIAKSSLGRQVYDYWIWRWSESGARRAAMRAWRRHIRRMMRRQREKAAQELYTNIYPINS